MPVGFGLDLPVLGALVAPCELSGQGKQPLGYHRGDNLCSEKTLKILGVLTMAKLLQCTWTLPQNRTVGQTSPGLATIVPEVYQRIVTVLSFYTQTFWLASQEYHFEKLY